MTEKNTSMTKPLLRISFARSLSPSPIALAASGAPPPETKAENAAISVIIGEQSPSPPRAAAPTSGMLPMYILSTMLYSRLTTCASTHGMPMPRHSRHILSLPIS